MPSFANLTGHKYGRLTVLRETGLNYQTLLRRLGNGWNAERALTVKPVIGRNQYP